MKFVILAALAGLCFAAAPALAADPVPPAPPAPESQASAHALELARRYVQDLHFQATMDTMGSKLWPVIMDQLSRSIPDADKALTPELKQAMGDVMSEWMHEETPKMEAQMVKLSAEIYTEQELADLIAFQESPTGRSIRAKAPLFAAHTGELMKSMHILTGKEVLERVCKKVDCAKLLSPTPDLPDKKS